MGAAALRRRIRKLERNLQEMNRRQEEMRREQQEQNEAQLRRMRQEVEQMDARQVQRVREMQEEIGRELHDQMEQLRREDARAQAERQRLLDELAQVERELKEELEEIRLQERQREEVSRETAERFYQEAEAQAEAASETAHAFFCPGQLEIFREHLEAARTMLRTGMYDAAAASADAAAAELEILRINVREQQREWLEMFQAYRILAGELYGTLERFEQETLETVCGRFRLKPVERDYWSQERYAEVRDAVLASWETVRELDAAGSVEAYLRGGKGVKGFQLTRQISALHRLSERLLAAMLCIRSERTYSDQRYMWGQDAAERLETAGYQVLDARFRGEPEESIDCYEVTAAMGDDLVTVTFAPRREDGVTVENVCLLTLDARVVPNPVLIQARAEEIQGYLRELHPGLRVEWYQEGDARRETARKNYIRKPDMNALAKRLERRYQ